MKNLFDRSIQFSVGIKSINTKLKRNRTGNWPIFTNMNFEESVFFKCRYASSVGVRSDEGGENSNHVIHNDVVGLGQFEKILLNLKKVFYQLSCNDPINFFLISYDENFLNLG